MKLKKKKAIALILTLLAILVAYWPVTTRFGIDYVLHDRKIRFYEKALYFLARHLETQTRMQEILQGITGDEEKILTLFNWTVKNIRPVPSGMPIVDDHPLYNIIRGYGAEDQQAEVLALLASYAGYPSGVQRIEVEGGSGVVRVTVVKHKEQIFVFDVSKRIAYQDTASHLIDLQRLRSEPSWVQKNVKGVKVEGQNYERFFWRIDEKKFSFSRMELQNPWFRLLSCF